MIVVETHSPEALVKSRQFLESQRYSIREIRLENRFRQFRAGSCAIGKFNPIA